jgi:hypothetical protein
VSANVLAFSVSNLLDILFAFSSVEGEAVFLTEFVWLSDTLLSVLFDTVSVLGIPALLEVLGLLNFLAIFDG